MNNLSASKKPTSKLQAVLTGDMLLKRNMIAPSKAEDPSSAFVLYID
jgi:hypothetical protein